ncbi:16S rRNA (cytidine1402-2'-O)-methyltransferase [Pullulanibacillus pueri]|uniref:Ribosomal RNA small subunit methyltransferase I n=1 Tax=Pullulanibacillus pueri TaxID=1437324 RepID=A0A8J2ZZZ9_9BACL|nr:16S rRNA (cytidine(1402)-2'-O)-methyltransferase [Pullulanibacillus pueri]MBM7683993.1 16S rRNA (cytidine1402-2'-O)-methyltransferase [Pullulanibacillus pueri]GGH88352.1 ribosomal RNA small subunit methyltransferase I [Pullulanibacillus pueri]
MIEQKSFQNETDGQLFLVPTPIGNLEDMSFRAIATLQKVDIIAAEDTRHTLKLCNHFDIHKPLVSYHEHNKKVSGEKLLKVLQEGQSVGLVTDAGTPGISDPGADLVRECMDKGISVIPLPGANAVLPALIASGQNTDHFLFYGFLPRQKKERAEILSQLAVIPYTLIFYEAPHRLKQTLGAMKAVLGNRKATLARELTKKHETFLRGNIEEIERWAIDQEVKGECCLIIEGGTPVDDEGDQWWDNLTVIDHVNFYLNEKGLEKKEAIKQTALDRRLPKREVYNTFHEAIQ